MRSKALVALVAAVSLVFTANAAAAPAPASGPGARGPAWQQPGADGAPGPWSGPPQTWRPPPSWQASSEVGTRGAEEPTESSEEAEEAAEGPSEETSEQEELYEELEVGETVENAAVAEAQTEVAAKKKRKRKKHKIQPKEEPPQEVERASPGRTVIGVDSGGWSGSTFSDLSKGGIDYIRTSSASSSYVEREAHAAGVQIATIIFGEGGSIGSISPSAYAAEVRSYFAKYGLDGGMTVEVLNEPGNDVFWSDPGDYTAYAKLAQAVHEALATLPAASRPVELCSWDGGEASPNADKPWGQGIKAAGALPYCEGVTVHPYGGHTGGDGGALGGRKDVELAHTESGKPVYVTEIGWPTAVGQPPTGDSQQWTEAQQAANITGFMQWASATGYVPMVIYFNFVDYGTNDFYGIETKERKHKLGFAALAEASARW